MKMTEVKIQNFRGLKDVTVPLSSFGCLIGENNAGKSSVLQAILLLLPGSSRRAVATDFYDPTEPLRVELVIDDVTDADLQRIENEQHRASFKADVVDGQVRLVRKVELASARSQLLVSRLRPAEDRWGDDALVPVMKGKSGSALREAAVVLIPELDARLDAKPTQTTIRAVRDELVVEMADDLKVFRDEPLGTGLDAGIKNFLPEPIYIEAVKDVSDEVKTSDSATFGKLLTLLLEEVQEHFADIEDRFREIHKQISRVVGTDGTITDERLDQVRIVESLINDFVRESFPEVGLTINVPVPRMKTILASAEIYADDGHDGPVISKGDGLKRAVAFAILRAYTRLRASGTREAPNPHQHWLLFEEPELYLYPRAQRQLYSALQAVSADFPVLVTTHSPLFFDAESTQTFTKLRKVPGQDGSPPTTEVKPVRIGDDLGAKTAFQIICHENNSIGFFARKVVLVEGDSDAILFPHLARLLNPEWSDVEANIAFARINGKGNIGHYRTFFSKFDVPISVVCDLDTLLGGFDKLEPSTHQKELRDELLREVDSQLESTQEKSASEVAELHKSGDFRSRWRVAHEAIKEFDGTEGAQVKIVNAVEEFFSYQRSGDRHDILMKDEKAVSTAKTAVIESLRENGVHVLSQGAVENYYDSSSKYRDKVRQAVEFRATCVTLEDFRASLGSRSDVVEAELRSIFSEIFADEGRA
ncbi:MAG: ATP-dependent nuclease [Microbacterium sp.]|uniref:ATP-dependent nuclease n=1 Tax=Microbacterium sp. TaxID=51671 RepID=UPI003D6F426E